MGGAHGIVLPEADAGRLARLAGGGAESVRVVVEGLARAVRVGLLAAPEPERDTGYDPSLVNADCDLARLADRLTRPGASRPVSFLLSGPPGSGKSAWI